MTEEQPGKKSLHQGRFLAMFERGWRGRILSRSEVDLTPSDDPFYLGYSHEAMARARLLDGNKKDADDNLSSTRKYADQVADVENRKLLMSDLGELT